MKSVTVRKEALLSKLTANRTNHRALYQKAEEGYRQTVIDELNHQLELAKSKKPVKSHIMFDPPADHTGEYDTAIAMLEMSIDETITIDEREFNCYVLDKWPWFGDLVKNQTYASNLRKPQ